MNSETLEHAFDQGKLGELAEGEHTAHHQRFMVYLAVRSGNPNLLAGVLKHWPKAHFTAHCNARGDLQTMYLDESSPEMIVVALGAVFDLYRLEKGANCVKDGTPVPVWVRNTFIGIMRNAIVKDMPLVVEWMLSHQVPGFARPLTWHDVLVYAGFRTAPAVVARAVADRSPDRPADPTMLLACNDVMTSVVASDWEFPRDDNHVAWFACVANYDLNEQSNLWPRVINSGINNLGLLDALVRNSTADIPPARERNIAIVTAFRAHPKAIPVLSQKVPISLDALSRLFPRDCWKNQAIAIAYVLETQHADKSLEEIGRYVPERMGTLVDIVRIVRAHSKEAFLCELEPLLMRILGCIVWEYSESVLDIIEDLVGCYWSSM